MPVVNIRNLAKSRQSGPSNKGPTNLRGLNPHVVALQQFLINIGFPIGNKKDPKKPDGIYGPITNDSLMRFIANVQATKSTAPETQKYKEIANALQPYASDDYKQTAANMPAIAKVVVSSGLVGQSDSAVGSETNSGSSGATGGSGSGAGSGNAGPENAGGKINNSKPGMLAREKQTTSVMVPWKDGTIKFPLFDTNIENPENFEETLMLTDMVDRDSTGKGRQTQIATAVQALLSAVPDDFSATQERIVELERILINRIKERRTALDAIRDQFGIFLQPLKPDIKNALEQALLGYLKGEEVVDNAGYITNMYEYKRRSLDITNYIKSFIQKYSQGNR